MNEQNNTTPAQDTRTLADGPADGLGRTAFWEKQMRLGRKVILLAGGVDRLINVQAELIGLERKGGGSVAGYSIRENDDDGIWYPVWAREIEVVGTISFELHPEAPIPCTEGRGIAYLRTSAPIRCYVNADVGELPSEADKLKSAYTAHDKHVAGQTKTGN